MFGEASHTGIEAPTIANAIDQAAQHEEKQAATNDRESRQGGAQNGTGRQCQGRKRRDIDQAPGASEEAEQGQKASADADSPLGQLIHRDEAERCEPVQQAGRQGRLETPARQARQECGDLGVNVKGRN